MQEFGNLLISTANSVKYKIISISQYHSQKITGGSQRLHVCQDWVLRLTKQKSTPTRNTEAAGRPTSQKTVHIYHTTRCQFRLTPCCLIYCHDNLTSQTEAKCTLITSAVLKRQHLQHMNPASCVNIGFKALWSIHSYLIFDSDY